MSILGTVMPNSSKPAVAMALLTRWPTNDDNKEEDELNYAPLPHLSLSLLLSPLLPPRMLFSCPALSALPAMAAAAAALFPRGSPLLALPWAAARAPSSPSSPSAHLGGGAGGTALHLGGNGNGGPLRLPPPPLAARPPGSGLEIWDSHPSGAPSR
jgi:hypothetical protein